MLTIIGSLLSFPVSLHADAHPSGCTFIAYRFLRDSVVKALNPAKAKAAILGRGFWLNLLESSGSLAIRSPRKCCRSRYLAKPVAKLPAKRGKSCH
jgi:hypothetical protein